MNTIHIIMEGGIVQDVLNVPDDTEVIVRDYDVDGVNHSDHCGQVNGNRCTEIHWEDHDEVEVDAFTPMTEKEWLST